MRKMGIVRPNIKWKKVILKILYVLLLDVIATVLIVFLLKYFEVEKQAERILVIIQYVFFLPISGLYARVFSTVLFISIIINLKRIMIFCVILYQKFAPEPMRASCLYTPSCSEYMILAIKKYGCIRGFIKGVGRLRRCHSPNGGIDYP